LQAALASNVNVPTPDSRDPEADEAGGTIVLRIPKSLHIGLKHAAQAEKTSLNQFALYALTKMVCQTTTPAADTATKIVGPKKKSAATRNARPTKRAKA